MAHLSFLPGRGAAWQLHNEAERAEQARPRLRDRRRVPRGAMRDEREQQVQDAVEQGKKKRGGITRALQSDTSSWRRHFVKYFRAH